MLMTVGKRASRIVAVAEASTTIADAARLMREHHVGALVVIESGADKYRPVGILTDRDIIVEIIATGLDPNAMTVGDVMSAPLTVAMESADIFSAIDQMRRHSIRRLPVIDASRRLVGICTLDDLMGFLMEELSGMVQAVSREQKKEARTRHGRGVPPAEDAAGAVHENSRN